MTGQEGQTDVVSSEVTSEEESEQALKFCAAITYISMRLKQGFAEMEGPGAWCLEK